ncbi:hypothetical protein Celaphus_00005531 [Cervus elaphus hippelaphus]|uniref:TBP n=1 Tax=Cervus elaphus hippelaphus TaxID=46360 RepID=A0A212CWD2_CEREH|nr:hypothetical protein Celaphus_00005531 [Cervus elaphus hippelaphus]
MGTEARRGKAPDAEGRRPALGEIQHPGKFWFTKKKVNIMDWNDSLSPFDRYLASPQGAMSPGIPVFSPMMHYGTGLTPQPVQSTDGLSTLEEEQQQAKVATGQLSTTSQQATQEASDQTPPLFNSQPLMTAPLLGTTPLYPSLMTPMTPMTPAMPASEITELVPQLHNIVCTVNLGCKLDLKRIALLARNAEYNPKRFVAVIMRIREPRTTALFFSSGKMVCTGGKSEEQSRLAARKYARIIQKLGFPAKFLDFKIQNMVGSCDVKFPIRTLRAKVWMCPWPSPAPQLTFLSIRLCVTVS